MKHFSKGFTLIELMIAVVLVVIITSTVYFGISSALDSWAYSRDRLSLQKVLSETIDRVINGSVGQYGLKDSLEIVSAGRRELEFVPPWIDDTHSVANLGFIYTMNRHLKPGSAVPVGQIHLPESAEWHLVPVSLVQQENLESSQVKLTLAAPEGSELRFIYHPDAELDPDTVKKIYWKDSKQVFLEDINGTECLSKNLFDVEITDMQIKYYNNANQLVTDREWTDVDDLPVITGIEVTLQAALGENKQNLTSFVSLRNAPMRTGYLSIKKGTKIHIPDGKNIRTLVITNLSGVGNKDQLQVEATPRGGKTWRVTAEFEKIGNAKPVMSVVTVEYPPETVVYTDYPKSSVDLGINLTLLDSAGKFDYDDDEDVDDTVVLEGDVQLEVTEMDIKGAGLFVRP